MHRPSLHAVALVSAAALLAACGGGDSGAGRGGNVFVPQPLPPPEDTGRALLAVAGVPRCGIDTRYLEYRTIGGQGQGVLAAGG